MTSPPRSITPTPCSYLAQETDVNLVQNAPIFSLPDEILILIFSLLNSPQDLENIPLVCKRWNQLNSFHYKLIWKQFDLYRLFPFPAFATAVSAPTVTLPILEFSLPTSDKREIIRIQRCFTGGLARAIKTYYGNRPTVIAQISIPYSSPIPTQPNFNPAGFWFQEGLKIRIQNQLAKLNLNNPLGITKTEFPKNEPIFPNADGIASICNCENITTLKKIFLEQAREMNEPRRSNQIILELSASASRLLKSKLQEITNKKITPAQSHPSPNNSSKKIVINRDQILFAACKDLVHSIFKYNISEKELLDSLTANHLQRIVRFVKDFQHLYQQKKRCKLIERDWLSKSQQNDLTQALMKLDSKGLNSFLNELNQHKNLKNNPIVFSQQTYPKQLIKLILGADIQRDFLIEALEKASLNHMLKYF